MIPVEQYAARTAHLVMIADELASLDQTWLELSTQFARVAAEFGEKRSAETVAGQLVAQLSLLDATLTTIEQTVADRMTVARIALGEVGDD